MKSLCSCDILTAFYNTATVITIATVAIATTRRATTTAATTVLMGKRLEGRSVNGSRWSKWAVGGSVERLWKQQDYFQTASSNALTPLLTSDQREHQARPYLQQLG